MLHFLGSEGSLIFVDPKKRKLWSIVCAKFDDLIAITLANRKLEVRGQFHQRSMHSFYIRKLRAQLFFAYVSGLYFTGV